MIDVQKEIRRFDPKVPVEVCPTPPASWYIAPEIYELEKRTVFTRNWQGVGRLDQFPESGYFTSGIVADEPYVVVRSDQGLHAHFNVCRHHATCVVEGDGCTNQLVCPYHGWAYDLDGRLRKAPKMAGVKSFDRNEFSLRSMDVDTFGPLVFIRPGQKGPPLSDVVAPLQNQIDFDGLRFVARKSYEIACNWKVYVDNYLDGGYHVPHLHTGLADQLDLGSYQTRLFDYCSTQGCGDTAQANTSEKDFSERLAGGAVYAWLYPNYMVNRYGPMMDTNWVVPLSAERTLTVFDYYFKEDCADDAAFVERSLEASHQVQLEDIDVCEAVQRGLRSRSYETGRYAPQVEHGEHHFHQLLSRDFLSDQ